MILKKISRLFVLGIAFFSLCLLNCIIPSIMAGHTPMQILEQDVAEKKQTINFENQCFILMLDVDSTIQPIGAHFETRMSGMKPDPQESYVLGAPGIILFEKISECLTLNNAKVYRKYYSSTQKNLDSNKCKNVILSVKDLQMHIYSAEQNFYLARSRISYGIYDGSDTVMAETLISIKETTETDLLEAIALQFVQELYFKIKRGKSL